MSDDTRPIIFTGWGVQRILADEKTMTRRPIKLQSMEEDSIWWDDDGEPPHGDGTYRGCAVWECDNKGGMPDRIACPYGQPGDILWVKETWRLDAEEVPPINKNSYLKYKEIVYYRADADEDSLKWNSSIFMRREYSRITLRIKDIRVERLKDITNEDCAAEGCRPLVDDTGIYDERVEFCELWDSIYAKTFPWESNPYVWAINFMRETERCI